MKGRKNICYRSKIPKTVNDVHSYMRFNLMLCATVRKFNRQDDKFIVLKFVSLLWIIP